MYCLVKIRRIIDILYICNKGKGELMKNKLLRYFSLALVVLIVTSATAVAKVEFSPELYKNLSQGKNKAPYIKTPDFKRIELDNKLVIYLMEDDSLPTVEITGYIPGGRSQEEKKLAGISDFMLRMMNTGTQNFSQQELTRYKELRGIDFGFTSKNDYYKFSGTALSTDTESLISLVADSLRNPDFEADYYSRVKQELARTLAQVKTQQDSLVNMYFDKMTYQNHPYSFASNYSLRQQALSNITPNQLSKFYQQQIVPNNIVLGVVGDIDVNRVEKLLKENFASWQEGELNFKHPKLDDKPSKQSQIIVVHKPDATQAKIRMGYNFFSTGFEEEVAFKMANRVYGGGSFSSRLMNNLRSDKGYVYSINSQVSYNRYGGQYYINTEVKPNKANQVLEEIRTEMLAIKRGKQKITSKELEQNINLYNALLPKSYQTKFDILDQVIYNSEIRGRKVAYVNQFITDYNQLTTQQVQQAFVNYTFPNRLSTVIVGNKEDIVPQFKSKNIDFKVINP
jgi:zinc protease